VQILCVRVPNHIPGLEKILRVELVTDECGLGTPVSTLEGSLVSMCHLVFDPW
jgi:hypothetical protein